MAKVRNTRDIRSNSLDKQAEKEKRSKIYTTERITQILKEQSSGGAPDMDPFWHGQTDYRDQGIAFEYTDKELLELERCANDCLYFVRNYVKFLNDKGRTLVTLRDYQERLLNLLSDEVYDEVSDTIIPKNHEVIIMQSRQTGKCVTGDTEIEIGDDYYPDFDKLTFKNYIKKIWKKLF